jgi:hypothetical protein
MATFKLEPDDAVPYVSARERKPLEHSVPMPPAIRVTTADGREVYPCCEGIGGPVPTMPVRPVFTVTDGDDLDDDEDYEYEEYLQDMADHYRKYPSSNVAPPCTVDITKEQDEFDRHEFEGSEGDDNDADADDDFMDSQHLALAAGCEGSVRERHMTIVACLTCLTNLDVCGILACEEHPLK